MSSTLGIARLVLWDLPRTLLRAAVFLVVFLAFHLGVIAAIVMQPGALAPAIGVVLVARAVMRKTSDKARSCAASMWLVAIVCARWIGGKYTALSLGAWLIVAGRYDGQAALMTLLYAVIIGQFAQCVIALVATVIALLGGVPLEDVELPRRKGRTLGSGKSMARDTERILRDEFRRRGR